MTFRFAMLALLSLTALGCDDETSAPPEPVDELSMRQLLDRVESGEIASVDDVLAALPDHQKQSFVLMERSGSRHQANVDHPRMILYGTGARFVVAVSTLPSDPLFETVEMFELDDETGLFELAAVTFGEDGPTFEGAERCAACHGDPPRPIWDEYPEWPGAFGPSHNDLTQEQARALPELRADPEHRIRFVAPWITDDYQLTERAYYFPNTNFNFELGMSVAWGLFTRMKQSPRYERFAPALLAARECDNMPAELGERVLAMSAEIDALAPRLEVLRGQERAIEILGLDLLNDWQLEVPIGETSLGDGYDLALWYSASDYLLDIVQLLVLRDLASTDPALAAAIAPVMPKIEQLYEYGWLLRGAERAAVLAAEDGIYMDPSDLVFQPLLGDSEQPTDKRVQVCTELVRAFEGE